MNTCAICGATSPRLTTFRPDKGPSVELCPQHLAVARRDQAEAEAARKARQGARKRRLADQTDMGLGLPPAPAGGFLQPAERQPTAPKRKSLYDKILDAREEGRKEPPA